MATLDEVMNTATEPTHEFLAACRAIAKAAIEPGAVLKVEASGGHSMGFHIVLDDDELETCPRIKTWRDHEGKLHVIARWDVD